jgi:hypothetical protein
MEPAEVAHDVPSNCYLVIKWIVSIQTSSCFAHLGSEGMEVYVRKVERRQTQISVRLQQPGWSLKSSLVQKWRRIVGVNGPMKHYSLDVIMDENSLL